MKQKNSQWQNKTEVKKGNIGEEIILEYLESKDFIVYKSITDGAHLIDYFGLYGNKDVYSFEVKTKRRRAFFPDTGFEYRHWQEYLKLNDKYNINIFFFFVDDFEKCIYGNWLSELKNEVKIIANGEQVVFPLKNMKKIANLSKEDIIKLRSYTTENYSYENIEKYFKKI